MIGFLKIIFYQPLYNGFVFLMDLLPWIDAGLAVIFFTVIVKLLLFPLSKKAVRTQLSMKAIAPEIEALKIKYKDNREEQARATMALYKEKGINPFSSILVIFIQLPIIFSLYYIFLRSGLPAIDTGLLYSFIPVPEAVNISFLGLIDISAKSWFLAILAAVTSFFQIRYSVPSYKAKNDKSFKDDLAKSMNIQMRYIFPVIVLFIAYSVSGAVALYWTTSNLFTLGQELVIRKQLGHGKEHN